MNRDETLACARALALLPYARLSERAHTTQARLLRLALRAAPKLPKTVRVHPPATPALARAEIVLLKHQAGLYAAAVPS